MAQVHVKVKLNREFEFILDAVDENEAEAALLSSREVHKKFSDACLDAAEILKETVYDSLEDEDSEVENLRGDESEDGY